MARYPEHQIIGEETYGRGNPKDDLVDKVSTSLSWPRKMNSYLS